MMLQRIGRADDPTYVACEKDVRHILRACASYSDAREQLCRTHRSAGIPFVILDSSLFPSASLDKVSFRLEVYSHFSRVPAQVNVCSEFFYTVRPFFPLGLHFLFYLAFVFLYYSFFFS